MEPSDLIKLVDDLAERLGIRYFVTGSHATVAYGEARFTNDIDIVVDLKPLHLDALCAAFPVGEFYLSRDAAAEAIANRGMFNIIHPTSGLKIDIIVPKQTPFDELRMNRAIRVAVTEEFLALFTTPEDIIVQKLTWHRMGGGERHLRDIAGVIKTRGTSLDRAYIERQAAELGVSDLWRDVLQHVEQ